jgi:hypothetical protein
MAITRPARHVDMRGHYDLQDMRTWCYSVALSQLTTHRQCYMGEVTRQDEAKLQAMCNVAARHDGVQPVLPKASFAYCWLL